MFKSLFKKENKVLEVYNESINHPYDVEEDINYIERLAKEDKNEFKNLVNLFESLPEKINNEISKKMKLASILSNLGHEPVKDFLIRVIYSKDDDIKKDSSYNWTKMDNKIWAAGNLVKFSDERGVEFIKKIFEKTDKNEKNWILEILSLAGNVMSISLILELAKKDKFIEEQIGDRKTWEEMLEKKLIKNS